jgi:hypothetical protein
MLNISKWANKKFLSPHLSSFAGAGRLQVAVWI